MHVLLQTTQIFRFNERPYKLLLEVSNLYLQWYFTELKFYKSKFYRRTLQLPKRYICIFLFIYDFLFFLFMTIILIYLTT